MTVHTMKDLKPGPENIFDAALKEARFLVRNGELFVISKAPYPEHSAEVHLTDSQLEESNEELEKLGRHGSKVIDQSRA